MTCIHTYIHPCMHACIHAYMHTYIHKYVRTYIRTYIRTYVHTYIRTYIHTYRFFLIFCAEALRDNCNMIWLSQNQGPQERVAAKPRAKHGFLTLGWQISRPLYMIPIRKILYTEWSRATQTVINKLCSLYTGHLINLPMSGKWHSSVYCCRFVRVYTVGSSVTDLKQSNHTETIEDETQCLGTTAITHVFRGSR